MTEDLMRLPRSAKEAKAINSMYYFTGKPCKNEHIDKIYTKNSTCIQCKIDAHKKYRINNEEKYKERNRLNSIKFAKKKRLCAAEWIKQNKDIVYARSASYSHLRQLRKENAFFQKKVYKKDIDELYLIIRKINKISPVKYSIDHIVPLQGKHVCGLHVPWNLRIITRKENSEKNSKMLKSPMEIKSYWDLKIQGELDTFIKNIYDSIANLQNTIVDVDSYGS